MSLQPLLRELQQRTRITARRSATEWQRTLRATSPIDTGNMVDQTRVTYRADSRGAVIEAKIDTDYAEYVRRGTSAHRITAVNAEALRFTVGGEVIFRKSVNHPGTRPNSWFDDSLRAMPNVIRRNWDRVNV